MISQRFSIGPADAEIAMLQWGESGKPPALLVHGTGFVADVWDEVARDLASTYTVYALDRRGHGASHKPDSYHFLDFAGDICRVIDALKLRNVYGIGHSAGATDLLLAAKLLPGCFTRLFVMEPTIMDPRAALSGGLDEDSLSRVQGALRRQAEFDNSDAVFNRYRAAPAFADWTDTSLRAYVRHGFVTLDDGRVRLCCMPEIESVQSMRRWRRSTLAMPAAIRSARSLKSIARYASRLPRSRGRSTGRWRDARSRSFRASVR